MRNSVYYGARGFAREINRQRSQHQRSVERAARKEAAIDEANYDATLENSRLKEIRNGYYSLVSNFMHNEVSFDLNMLKKNYIKNSFVFRDKPVFVDSASKIRVPNHKYLEKIFPSLKEKRIFKEQLKELNDKEDKKKYEESLGKYELQKEKAYSKFLEKEKNDKKEIEKFNKAITTLKEKYMDKDEDSIISFYDNLVSKLFENYDFSKMLDSYYLSYNPSKGNIIVTIIVKNLLDFFEYSQCVIGKVTTTSYELISRNFDKEETKEELELLLPKLAIGIANNFIENDKENFLNNVIVNFKYIDCWQDCVYAVSSIFEKYDFESYDLDMNEDVDHLISNMKIFNGIDEIKPYAEGDLKKSHNFKFEKEKSTY